MDIGLQIQSGGKSKRKVNRTKFSNSFSEEVFRQTYQFDNESDINERHQKVANSLASVESDPIL